MVGGGKFDGRGACVRNWGGWGGEGVRLGRGQADPEFMSGLKPPKRVAIAVWVSTEPGVCDLS